MLKKLNESQIRDAITKVLAESKLLNEVKTLVDNFTEIAKLIDQNNQGDPDKFYYIEIKKRFKDNRGLKADPKVDNFDGFGIYKGSFRVKTGQELLQLKPRIVQICDSNNARAYITQNQRSEYSIKNHVNSPRFQKGMTKRPSNIVNPEDVLAGQAKPPFDANGKQLSKQDMINMFGSDRSGFMFDIDEKDKRVWELTNIVLNHFGIEILTQKETPSGGLHIICTNTFNPNLPKAIELLRVFDHNIKFEKDSNGKVVFDRHGNPKFSIDDFFMDRGLNQTVHANFDGKMILYSNVSTQGY